MDNLDQVVRKWIIMTQFENDQQRYENLKNSSWMCDVEDALDGSDDVILTFPDELVLLMGWKSGTILDIDSQDGHVTIKEVKKS